MCDSSVLMKNMRIMNAIMDYFCLLCYNTTKMLIILIRPTAPQDHSKGEHFYMYLKYLQIKNFKNLPNARFEFAKGANTIIGENDAGKSNAMTALRILLDSSYYYNNKRLKESDFSDTLGDWRGHWIIISAFFDEISVADRTNEVCAELMPEIENADFLRSYVRCAGYDYGVVTLFIRPNKQKRKELATAASREAFDEIRSKIKLSDYEFYYTARAQTDFTDPAMYATIVGDLDAGIYTNPDDADLTLTGSSVNILSIWEHISLTFIDALRDVESELHKPKNPIKRIFDVIQGDLTEDNIATIKSRIHALNQSISEIGQVSDIGGKLNQKLQDIVGLVYSPEIKIESKLKEDIASIARHLSVSPKNHEDIELLGLGHLNILYIALKLVEFEYNRNHEILNIMIIEEPEAHIHTHIQKALFDNLNVSNEYTQVIMTTHSTHLSEVSAIARVNVIKPNNGSSVVMRPTNELDQFGRDNLELRDVSLSTCLERYLDAKRSVLLFSKGVILIEGDGEEILVPQLVKKALGISLDEIGIGLINVGSVAFEYIASVFAPERLQRYCAIVTDYDACVAGASKSKPEAEELGVLRKEKLARLFSTNPWVSSFYAPHTLEVDFSNIDHNRQYIESVISAHYTNQTTITSHKANLTRSEAARYDSVLTIATGMGKGWYATVLASKLDHEVIIPDYLISALAFASREVVTYGILRKMAINILENFGDTEPQKALKNEFVDAVTDEGVNQAIQDFCDAMPENSYSKFILHRRSLGLHG